MPRRRAMLEPVLLPDRQQVLASRERHAVHRHVHLDTRAYAFGDDAEVLEQLDTAADSLPPLLGRQLRTEVHVDLADAEAAARVANHRRCHRGPEACRLDARLALGKPETRAGAGA